MRINKICKCEKTSTLIHELAQPLCVIETYIAGCLYQLDKNTIDNKELIKILKKVILQTQLMEDKINRFCHYNPHYNKNGHFYYR